MVDRKEARKGAGGVATANSMEENSRDKGWCRTLIPDTVRGSF